VETVLGIHDPPPPPPLKKNWKLFQECMIPFKLKTVLGILDPPFLEIGNCFRNTWIPLFEIENCFRNT
jgi:hypothetical protein